MNIIVVVHYHYQGVCVPTALFVHEQMRAFVRRGHRVRVIVPIPYGKKDDRGRRLSPAVWQETVDGIEHVFLRHFSFSQYGIRGLNTRCAQAALKKNIKQLLDGFQPDVIHAHKLGTNTELGYLLHQYTGCPLVITSHGETICEEPWMHDPDMVKTHADKADVIVCVSSLLKNRLSECGISSPIQVILNGFNVQHADCSTGKDPFSIVQAGFLVARKKVDVSIRALALLRKKHPESSLKVIGSGGELEKLQGLCTELGVEDSVRFLGFLPNADTLSQMASSAFFVMPSVNEGFGIVYLEAMASGCITIGTEGEGIADLIVHGENGFLVPADDPDAIVRVIEWCLAHPDEADRIARNGNNAARELTWGKNADRYLTLFRELMKA